MLVRPVVIFAGPAFVACSLNARALDLDGDNYYGPDCDDTTDAVYPGAEERCDGADNDCDGTIDEGGACTSMSQDDARVAITGEGTLGRFMVAGLFDGDGFGDLLVEARLGGSSGVCLVPGARLVEGVAGAAEAEVTMSDIGSCWVGEGAMLGLAVTSAAPFGVTTSDVAWVLSSADGLCAVDPYGEGMSLEDEAYGCTSMTDWVSLSLGTPDQILSFGTADPETAALMALSVNGFGVARPTGLASDPAEFWGIQTLTPLQGLVGGEDIDGDGVADILAVDSGNVWVIASNLNLSAPVEMAGWLHLTVTGATGAVMPGDLDGDGREDFGITGPEAITLYSNGEPYAEIYGATDAAAAGDFNGDGRPDITVRRALTPSIGVLLPPFSEFSTAGAAQVQISTDSPSFGAQNASVDVDHNGRSDLWILDPGHGTSAGSDAASGPEVPGVVYLLSGFPIDAGG